jgi:hypothetical protein
VFSDCCKRHDSLPKIKKRTKNNIWTQTIWGRTSTIRRSQWHSAASSLESPSSVTIITGGKEVAKRSCGFADFRKKKKTATVTHKSEVTNAARTSCERVLNTFRWTQAGQYCTARAFDAPHELCKSGDPFVPARHTNTWINFVSDPSVDPPHCPFFVVEPLLHDNNFKSGSFYDFAA